MEKVFLITYDLRRPGQNYNDLYSAIKELGDWQHPLESTWMAKCSSDTYTEHIYKKLRPLIDDNDFLFIVDITGQDYYGWLSKEFWSWIKK